MAARLASAAADRRHTVSSPDRCSLAGCAHRVRAVGLGLRPVSPVAAGRHLAAALTRLQSQADAKGAIVWDLGVDSTVCRAHQHAAGARLQGDLQKEPPGGVFTEPRDHGLAGSRGGFTTMLHLAVEHGHKPMSILVAAGQRGTRRSSNRGEGPRAPPRAGTDTRSPRPDAGGQGIRLPQEPRLPAPPQDLLHPPGRGRPGAQPPDVGLSRWSASVLRRARLPRAPCGRVRD